MNSVSLALYVLRARDINERKYLNLDNICGKSFIQLFLEYCDSRKLISSNRELKKVINIKSAEQSERIIHGEIETGNYGYTSNIKVISTSKISHKKTIGEADMVPLFFCGFIPEDSYKGIVCLERFRSFGCKTILEDDFNSFAKDNNLDVRITLHPMLPQTVAKRYFSKGNICKLRLVKNSIPEDLGDINRKKYKIGEFGSFEYVLNAKRNKVLPFKDDINRFLNKEIELKNIIEIDKIEYDNIKVELEIGKKKRTISLGNIDNLVGDIDISDDVKFEIDGHPNYQSIKEIAVEIVLDYGKVVDYKTYKIEPNLEEKKEVRYDTNPITVE